MLDGVKGKVSEESEKQRWLMEFAAFHYLSGVVGGLDLGGRHTRLTTTPLAALFLSMAPQA